MQILQVITDDDRRGAQMFATELGDALIESGHAVRTVALAPGTVGGLDVPKLGRRRLGVDTLRALRAAMRAADVVVAHGSSTLPACALAGFRSGVPFVYRQISDSQFWAADRIRRARVQVGMSRAAHVVALWSGSAATLHTYLGVPAGKVTVIPNAVTPSRFAPAIAGEVVDARDALGLEAACPAVVVLGALAPEKGVDLVIDAVADLPDTQLLVAGDGPERARLEELARARAPGRVVFSGSLDDARRALVAADVVVLASRGGDSMPAVLIEAGLVARPAVSTPIGAIPEVVVDGVTGRIVPVDDVAALTAAIGEILQDRTVSGTMGAAARARCLEHYAIEPVARQWAAVLEACAR